MNQPQSRQQIWSLLEQNWDLIVIGGGITGAGIFKRAVSGGLKTLLLEAADFSSGTSSKSSKLVQLLRTKDGHVCGVAVEDQSKSNMVSLELKANAVINATGPWTDKLREQLGRQGRVRPLRGSHLVFSFDDLPIPHAVTLMHPKDHRAMFAIPWEGRTIFGTTDLDHPFPLSQEPYCTNEEITYILEAVNAIFPDARISEESIISSFAGLRPIVRGDADNPSAESRAHLVLEEDGLVTITGGKLTIFETMAEDTLKAAMPQIGKELKRIKHWFDQIGKDQMDVIRLLKDHFDPNNIMNPGGTLGLDMTPAQREKRWGKDLEA